jgi:hypothetical protein
MVGGRAGEEENTQGAHTHIKYYKQALNMKMKHLK